MSITIVCHDSGGAEILSHWVLENPNNYNYVLEGPAIKIFKRNIGYINIISLEESIKITSTYICGTSWQSDLEKKTLILAKNLGINSISYLDHWVSYEERFLYNNKFVLPNQIWVGDKHAEKIAKNKFPKQKIICKENPYFNYIKRELNFTKKIQNNQKDSEIKMLFLSENISDYSNVIYSDDKHFGYDDADAFNYFLTIVRKLNIPKLSITLRLHPSEKKNKYNSFFKNSDIKIKNNIPLLDQIVDQDYIFGCNTMALVISVLAKKKTITCIPPNTGQKCILPYEEIIPLDHFANNFDINNHI